MTQGDTAMLVFVVTADAISDVANEMLDSGGVRGVFLTVEKANDYVDTVVETYMHKRGDYTITEVTVA